MIKFKASEVEIKLISKLCKDMYSKYETQLFYSLFWCLLKVKLLACAYRIKTKVILFFELLRPVSTTSVEKSILCLFYCFFFALASILTARFNRRSIKETKNALFHACSGNGPLKNKIFICQSNQKKFYLTSANFVDIFKALNH